MYQGPRSNKDKLQQEIDEIRSDIKIFREQQEFHGLQFLYLKLNNRIELRNQTVLELTSTPYPRDYRRAFNVTDVTDNDALRDLPTVPRQRHPMA